MVLSHAAVLNCAELSEKQAITGDQRELLDVLVRSRSQFHCVWLAVPKPTEFVITGTEFRPLKSLAVRRYPLPGQGSAFGDNQGSDALIASCAVAQKRGMIGLKTSRSSLYNHTVSSTRANGTCFISVKNSPLVSLVQHPM